jgi:hypothetical protein
MFAAIAAIIQVLVLGLQMQLHGQLERNTLQLYR